MDETWIHILVYDPETKEQPKKWRHSGSPHPKKFKMQKSSSKLLSSRRYYVAFLDRVKQQLVSKYQGKLSKEVLFLQDIAAPHKASIIHQKLAGLHFEVLEHLSFSPEWKKVFEH
jgi:hypothetical protein